MALTLATFNVKDLFDATTPEDEARLARKLAVLGAQIAQTDADVLALQEVSSEAVVRRLCAAVPGSRYGAPVVGTADARGIRCALVSRRPVLGSRVHTAHHLDFPTFVQGDPPPFGARIPLRRGIVHAELDVGWGPPLHVLVLHFKSNRSVPLRGPNGELLEPTRGRDHAEGMLRSLTWRAAEALFVRGLVDAITDVPEGTLPPPVAVMGDFNDVPGSVVVRTLLGQGAGALTSCSHTIPGERRFSVLHRGAGSEIDHLLVNFPARLTHARFLNEGLVDHEAFDDPLALVDSDHAPLVATFDARAASTDQGPS